MQDLQPDFLWTNNTIFTAAINYKDLLLGSVIDFDKFW